MQRVATPGSIANMTTNAMQKKTHKANLEVFVGLFHNKTYQCNMGNGFQLITTPTLKNQVHVEINMVTQA